MKYSYILLACALLLFVGCTHHEEYPKELIALDSLSETAPDSALTRLRHLEPSMMHAAEPIRNYYRLLCIKAVDKAYIPHTSDSTILELVSYYESCGDPSLLPMAYYYAGRINADMNNRVAALDYYQKALAITKDKRLHAKINSQIGEILFYQDLYDESLKYVQNAKMLDESEGNHHSLIFDLRDIGHIYREKHDIHNAIKYYTQAYELAKQHDTLMASELEAHLAYIHHLNGNDSLARLFVQKSIKTVDPCDTICIYSIATDVYLAVGELDSAKLFANFLLHQKDVAAKEIACSRLIRIAEQQYDTASLFQHLKNYQQYNDTVTVRRNAEVIAKMVALYDYSQKEKEVAELKMDNFEKSIWIVAILTAFLLSAIFGYHLWRQNQIKKQRLIQNFEIYQAILEEERKSKKVRVKLDVRQISRQGIENTELHKKIVKQRENSETICLSDDEWKEMARIVDSIYPAFTFRLHQFYPKIKQHEYRVSLALKFGLHANEIADATNHSRQAISSARSRLFEKVMGKKGVAADWDQFIQSL